MTKVLDHVLSANADYVAHFDKGNLPLVPAMKVAILTCMDARLDPHRFAGLDEGDVHIIRNAGGRATDDAIRSLILSHKLLGTNEWFVIHHTDCGLGFITNDGIADLLSESLDTAARGPEGFYNLTKGSGSDEGYYINWFTIRDQAGSVVDDVRRIRNHPLVSSKVAIYGYIYDVKTGRLIEVPGATEVGKPTNE